MDDLEKQEDSGAGDNQKLLTDRRVEEVVRVFDHYYATRTSDAYRAMVMETADAVLLWRLRYPLDIHDDTVPRFLHRMQVIQGLSLTTPEIRFIGVDPNGCAFVVTAFESGRALFETVPSIQEAQRIFMEAVRIVSQIHEHGLVLGDICGQSFLLREGGQVFIQGLLGPFDREATQTSLLPSVESLQFLSPEQRTGHGVEPASDVYALGIFAYRLFTGRYLYGDQPPPIGEAEAESFTLAPSSVRNEVPLWVDDIIGKCIDPRAEQRYPTARQLLDDIQLALGGTNPTAAKGRWSSRTLIVQPETIRAIRKEQGKAVREDAPVTKKPDAARSEGKKPATFLLIFAPALLIGVALATAIFLFIDNTTHERTALENEIALHEQVAPPELKRPMEQVIAVDVPLETRKQALQQIAESDDAVAYLMLVSVAKSAPVFELKLAAQDVIVERIRRFGLRRSADVVKDWFQKKNALHIDAAVAPAFQPLLNACNPNFGIDRRRFSLNQAYRAEPFVTLQLAAALALDEKDPDSFSPVLRQLLSAQLSRDDLDGKSVGALILVHPALAQYFQSDIESFAASFSNEDLGWLLMELARSNNPLLYAVAEETLKRNIVPPFQAVFLRALVEVNRFGLSQQVTTSLIHGARGEYSEQDVIAFGRWINIKSEPVLLAICTLATDESVSLGAFDTLAARSMNVLLVEKILDKIKASYWDQRQNVVKAVGILGLSDVASDEQIRYAFDSIIPYLSLDSLVGSLVAADDEKLIYLALDRFSGLVGGEHLIKLLSHPSKRVRIAAVKGLKGNNELRVLQAILRAYKKEQDNDLRKLYNELHWVTVQEQPQLDINNK